MAGREREREQASSGELQRRRKGLALAGLRSPIGRQEAWQAGRSEGRKERKARMDLNLNLGGSRRPPGVRRVVAKITGTSPAFSPVQLRL